MSNLNPILGFLCGLCESLTVIRKLHMKTYLFQKNISIIIDLILVYACQQQLYWTQSKQTLQVNGLVQPHIPQFSNKIQGENCNEILDLEYVLYHNIQSLESQFSPLKALKIRLWRRITQVCTEMGIRRILSKAFLMCDERDTNQKESQKTKEDVILDQDYSQH